MSVCCFDVAVDGTSRLGGAINIAEKCPDNLNIQHRLLSFVTAKPHLKAPQFSS